MKNTNRTNEPLQTNTTGHVLELVNVTKTYKLGNVEVQALRGVNLVLDKGDFVSIMGPSGSGKTTLLNLVGALDKPSSGIVKIDGQDIALLSDRKLTSLRATCIGFVFQFYNLVPVLSALENVEMPMIAAGMSRSQRHAAAIKLLAQVGLEHRLNQKPEELSGGERQRVAIARALANNPQLILADEPTGDLDSKTGAQVMDIFRQLNEEHQHTFLIVTHDPKVGAKTRRIIQIQDGLIIEDNVNPIERTQELGNRK